MGGYRLTKEKICIVITARPSYSRFKTALDSINRHPDLELEIILSGSALLPRYGSIINYLKNDGYNKLNLVYNVLEGENQTSMKYLLQKPQD